MKKRLISGVLCIVFMLALLPLAASAAVDFNSYTPYDLTAKLINQDETHPYGSTLLTFKINNLPHSSDTEHWYVEIEKKIGDNPWSNVLSLDSVQCLDDCQISPGMFEIEQLWNEDYNWDGSVPISFRVCVTLYDYSFSSAGASPWSQEATIGLKSSSWAVAELQKAIEYGLIPASLSGKDMTAPITREEFAEIAVRLYEIYTGMKARAGSASFTDIANPEILKAANLGLVLGVGEGKYAPHELVTREQMGTILLRALKVINPTVDFSITGAAKFADDTSIAGWAKEGVYYCAKAGIIKGTGNNLFSPKGNSTREAAVIVCTRSYEYFKSDVESGEEADDFSGSSTSTQGSDAADINQFLIGKWALNTPDGTYFYHFKEDKTLEVSKENDSTGGHLSFMYEVLDDELTVYYYSHTESTITEGGITDTVSSDKQIYQKCVISIVDNETLLMDDVQVVRVK